MSALAKLAWIGPEEYLEGEKRAQAKHEYVAGRVYAMVGASRRHNLVAGNIHTALNSHLKNSPCQVFMADMKIRTAEAFYYPDVAVSCDKRENQDDYCEYPLLICEVASPSTENIDDREKRSAYQSLASLQEYLLAAQDRQEIKLCRRAGDSWEMELYGPGDTVCLHSLEFVLPMAEIYAKTML